MSKARKRARMRAAARAPAYMRDIAASKGGKLIHKFSSGAASDVRVIVRDGKPAADLPADHGAREVV